MEGVNTQQEVSYVGLQQSISIDTPETSTVSIKEAKNALTSQIGQDAINVTITSSENDIIGSLNLPNETSAEKTTHFSPYKKMNGETLNGHHHENGDGIAEHLATQAGLDSVAAKLIEELIPKSKNDFLNIPLQESRISVANLNFQQSNRVNEGLIGIINQETIDDYQNDSKSDTTPLEIGARAINERRENGTNIVSCGSVSLTSDNDYTMVGKTTYSNGEPRVVTAGGPHFRDQSGSAKYDAVIDRGKDLLKDVDKNYQVVEMDGPKGLRELTPDMKKNAINALSQANYNWFKAIELYAEKQPQVLWDIRSLEKSITKDLCSSIEDTWKNLSEVDMVKKANEGIRSIFGKEAGVLFDTNYYTAGAILKEGFNISNSSQMKRWDNANDIQAMVKVASNYKANFGDRQKFDDYCSKSGISEKVRDAAWSKMEVREKMIETQAALVEKKAKKEIGDLKDQISKMPEGDSKKILENKLNSLQSKLDDHSAIELEAMNGLYVAGLSATQEKIVALDTSRHRFETKINEAIKSLKPSDPAAFQKLANLGKFDEIENLPKMWAKQLKMMKADLDRAGNDVIDCQTNSLLFANEPYYSQATVVAVVGGLQMKKDGNDFPLLNKKDTFAMSMRENFGDFAKDMHHYHDSPEKFAYKGSKYLSRVLLSAKNCLPEGNEVKTEVDKMYKLSNDLLSIRKSNDTDNIKKEKSMNLIKNAYPEYEGQDSAVIMENFFSKAEDLTCRVSLQARV